MLEVNHIYPHYSLADEELMNSVETYQKRLREEVSLVEQEIESHNQQIESLNTRLEGLKRALELCDSEQIAVAELLRTGAAGLQFDATTSRSSAPFAQKVAQKSPVVRGAASCDAQRTKSAIAEAALDRRFGWKCGESNLTAHLYTNPDRFVHT
jgi:predicted nuclease with TOPRIM domain